MITSVTCAGTRAHQPLAWSWNQAALLCRMGSLRSDWSLYERTRTPQSSYLPVFEGVRFVLTAETRQAISTLFLRVTLPLGQNKDAHVHDSVPFLAPSSGSISEAVHNRGERCHLNDGESG